MYSACGTGWRETRRCKTEVVWHVRRKDEWYIGRWMELPEKRGNEDGLKIGVRMR